MKMKINALLFVILMGLASESCRKDAIEVYHNSDYLYFDLPSNDSTTLSFFFHPGKSTVEIPLIVRLIGKPAPIDRYFNVEVDSKGTTLPSQYYTLPAKPIFRAGHATDTIFVSFKNYPELKTIYKTLRINLESNEKFALGPTKHSSAFISVTDQASKPAWWDPNNYVELYGEENYELGRFTVKKYSLFIEVTGIVDMTDLSFDEQRAAELQFKYYLIEQKDNGHEVMEDDGTPMTVYIYG
ncbi:MAG: DUF4843 domain-containing protein [Ginsengibacter sp.]